MAGKLNKILLGTALAGAAVAGGLAYFLTRKEKENSWEDDLEDFDDNLSFDDDEDDDDVNAEPEAPVSREYVTIPTENRTASETLKKAPEAGLEDSPVAENLKAAMEQVANRVSSTEEEAPEE